MMLEVYSAIICCERDEHLVQRHIDHLRNDVSGAIEQQCVYYGRSLTEREQPYASPSFVVGALDIYENLPLKTYCMLEHALRSNWDVLLKTDVNAAITSIDWAPIVASDLCGFVCDHVGGRRAHAAKVTQACLAEPYSGPLPGRWIGGPAYTVSRRLAKLVVARGVWFARSHVYEDQMVSLVAEEHGIIAEQAIMYEDQ